MSRSPLTRKPDPDYQCAVCLGGKGCRPFPLTITAIRQFTPDNVMQYDTHGVLEHCFYLGQDKIHPN